MSDWYRALLGLEENELPPPGEEAIWEFSGLPTGDAFFFALVIVVAAVVFIALLYRRERNLSILQRITLSGLRLGSLALVIVILLNPRLITEIHHERSGKTLVILDQSASMGQQDTFDPEVARRLQRSSGLLLSEKPSRWQLVEACLRENEILEALARKNDVHLFALAESTERLESLDAVEDVALKGHRTALGDGIREAVRQTGTDLLAAVVLISDGRNNAGQSPVEMVRDPLATGRWPIHTVGVGQQQIQKNYAVVDLLAPAAVEVGFPIQVEARLRLSGIRGPVRVTLTRSDRDGNDEQVVEERFLELTGALLESRLKFIDVLPEKGDYVYQVEIPHKPEETRKRDNVRTVRVTASEERHRVLFVCGSPGLEYIFANTFFLRDPGIQVSTWLSSADPRAPREGDVPLKELPRTALEMKAFDIVVLLDPDPASLTPEFGTALLEFVVEQGGGLAFIASDIHTPELARASHLENLRKLLPVDLKRHVFGDTETFTRPWRPRLTAAGLEHPILRLENTEKESLEVWESLPPFYFVYPRASLKPSARALLAGPEGEILSAVHQAGLGDSLYLGTDDFHRLRHSGRGHHERFWAGTLRFLAQGKKRAGLREITVESDRDRYTVGEQAQIFLHIQEGEDSRLRPPHQEVELVRLGLPGDGPENNDREGARRERDSRTPEQQLRLRLYQTPGNPDRYTGFYRTNTPGDIAIHFEDQERTSFRVQPVSSEYEDPSPSHETLEELASASGGTYLPLERAERLDDLIADASVREVVGRRAATLWDSAFLMGLFCGLLSLEWILRKIWHLN